jgi:Kef-type K+ transport system membrane component KefB
LSFGVLALIVLAGLAGPFLAAGRHSAVPVVVGELAAGVVIGDTGTHWLDPSGPTISFLYEVGFAMLMFAAGMHVPIRHPGIRRGLRVGLAAAVLAGVLAVPAGIGVAAASGAHHAAIYALLLASGSAAVLLPVIEDAGLTNDSRALTVMAQVGIADVAAIVALPMVMQPGKALHAALGGLAVGAAAVGILAVAKLLRRRTPVRGLRRASKKRGWALDLRLSLLVLFSLAWLAQRTGTSILIAGFAVGLLVAAIGGPKRLSRQVTGIAAGFFIPLFFVVLGAKLDLRALVHHPSNLEIAALLLAANVAVHLVVARATRQPLAAGLAATAQLGLPAGVVTLGLQLHTFTPGVAAAILLAALGTIVVCSVGVALLRREFGGEPVESPEHPQVALPNESSP